MLKKLIITLGIGLFLVGCNKETLPTNTVNIDTGQFTAEYCSDYLQCVDLTTSSISLAPLNSDNKYSLGILVWNTGSSYLWEYDEDYIDNRVLDAIDNFISEFASGDVTIKNKKKNKSINIENKKLEYNYIYSIKGEKAKYNIDLTVYVNDNLSILLYKITDKDTSKNFIESIDTFYNSINIYNTDYLDYDSISSHLSNIQVNVNYLKEKGTLNEEN